MSGTVNYPWPVSTVENGETLEGVGLGDQTPAPATRANAVAALATLAEQTAPRAAQLLYDLTNITLPQGDYEFAISGATNWYTAIAITVSRYLQNPV
jgi:hypothetical protein